MLLPNYYLRSSPTLPADVVAPGTRLLGVVIDDPLGESTLLVDMKIPNHSGVNSVAEVEGPPPSVGAVLSCPADMLFPLIYCRSGRITQDIPSSCTCCLKMDMIPTEQ